MLTSGIRFAIYPRPRTARREQAAFKVKSILKGTEYDGMIFFLNSSHLPRLIEGQFHAKNSSAGFNSRLLSRSA
jgi:hypothetical protein